jgi:ankyrin repeat protein
MWVAICLFRLDQLRLACGDIFNGNLKKVIEILSQFPSLLNEDLNEDGWTALMIASSWNSVSVVEYLLSCDSIEVNKRTKV